MHYRKECSNKTSEYVVEYSQWLSINEQLGAPKTMADPNDRTGHFVSELIDHG